MFSRVSLPCGHQSGLAPHQPGDGDMGEGHEENRKGQHGQDLGREFGREVRGTTAGIFSRKT